MRDEFDQVLERYRTGTQDSTVLPEVTPPGSEPSWDYCYSWFRAGRGEDLRRDCLELGYYLANWGMFRGSGALMRTNLTAFVPVMDVINAHDEEMRGVQLAGSNSEWRALEEVYGALSVTLPSHVQPSATLITKVILGVWGCIPAMDTYVLAGVRKLQQTKGKQGIASFNRNYYDFMVELTQTHTDEIDRYRTTAKLSTFNSDTTVGAPNLPVGKVLDMYLFQIGTEVLNGES